MERMGEEQADALEHYFKQIRKKPLLTFEQEKDLAKQIAAGDKQARKALIESNLRLVVNIAKSFLTADLSLLDLIQEGNLGLIKAVSKYDYKKNVRFSTYASWWIKQAIVRSLSSKRRTIRIPHRKEEILRKINKTYNSLLQVLMRRPTLTEIAVEMGLPKEKIYELLKVDREVVSLDSDTATGSANIKEVFEDYSYNPAQTFMEKNLREETMKFLKLLQQSEKEVLLYRYSFYGGRKYTLQKIADRLGVSPETVRITEMRALKKMSRFAGLKEYVHK